jgi:hypothetical protein
MLKRTLITSSVLAAGLGVLAAQAPQPPATPATPTQPGQPAATMKTYRAKEVLGTKMSIEGNTNIGTVDDIVLSEEGVIQYLIVTTADNKLFTVPWEAAKFDWARRTAVLNINQERLRTIPTYTVETYPQFYTPTYRTEIYRVYGLTPGEARRLERRIERRDDRRP